ncbi:MAG: DUF6077 domain-containing protein [Lachnospiraceae bacterium]
MDELQQIIRIVIVGSILLISCYLTGSLVNKSWKIESDKGILFRVSSISIIGWLIELAIFQILSVPMVILNIPFTNLVYIYTLCIVVISFVAVLVCRKELFLISPKKFEGWNLYRVFAIGLILFQIVFLFFLYQVSEDGIFDYTVVANTIRCNTMFRTYPYTGYECSLVYFSDRFINGYYMYRAFLTKVMDFHPTMVGRTILPPISLMLSYACYYRLGNYLLRDDKKTDIFMIFLSVLNIFGSVRLTPMVTLMTDATNGKTLFVNIVFPLMILSFLSQLESSNKKKHYFFLLLLNICASAMSTTSLFYAAFITVLFAGIVAYKKKRIRELLYSFLTIIPNIVYFILYFLEKGFELWK